MERDTLLGQIRFDRMVYAFHIADQQANYEVDRKKSVEKQV